MADCEIIIDCGGSAGWRPPEGAEQVGPRQWLREWGPKDHTDRDSRIEAQAMREKEKLTEQLIETQAKLEAAIALEGKGLRLGEEVKKLREEIGRLSKLVG